MGEIDVAIVGGGVVGVACASELARRGARVTVLERDRIGRACSYGNAGWLTPSQAVPIAAPANLRKAARWILDPESPFYIRPRLDPALAVWLARFLAASRRDRFERGTAALVPLCEWSVDRWEDLAGTSPDPFGFERAGLLAVYESAGGFAAGRAAAGLAARFGIPHEIWSPDEVREREPAVRGALIGAVLFPRDAHCEPYPAVSALAEEARRAGATFAEETEVYAVERDGDRVRSLETTRGRIECGEIVLAAGAWSATVARILGCRLPVLGAKGYSVVVPRREPHPSRSVLLAERKIAVNPHADTLRISGTLELTGEDTSVSARRVGAIVRGAREMLGLPDPLGETEVWRGLRPCTPDGIPVVGRARRIRNLWFATGHQMTGLKTAPGTGRLLADLMSGDPPTFDPEPFLPSRFGA